MADTKSVKATFSEHVPMGTMATFTHEKELWIAYPASKNQAIFGLVSKLVSAHKRSINEMVSWINQRPQDAELVARVLEMHSAAVELGKEFTIEKVEVFTS